MASPISSGLISQFLELGGGIDLTEFEDKARQYGLVDFQQGVADEFYDELQGYYEQLQDELDPDRPWYQELLGGAFEWGLNLLGASIGIPIGSIITSLYDYDHSMDAISNYENAVAQMQEEAQGTFLSEWIDSADDFVKKMKDMTAVSGILDIGADILMPQVFDVAESAVPVEWKDAWKEFTEPLKEGFSEDLQIFNDLEDYFTAQAAGENPDYSESLDLNLDGNIDIEDIMLSKKAADDVTFWDKWNPFEEGEYEITPEPVTYTFEEIKESVMAGENIFSHEDLIKAQEKGAVTFEAGHIPFRAQSMTIDPLQTNFETISEGFTMIHPASSVTEDWDNLGEATKEHYLESLDWSNFGLPDDAPEELKNQVASLEWQKQHDFLTSMNMNMGDVFNEVEELDLKGKRTGNIGYEYNILGNNFNTQSPLEFWEENYDEFSDDWDEELVEDITSGQIWPERIEVVPALQVPADFYDTIGAVQPAFSNQKPFSPGVWSIDPTWTTQYQAPNYFTKDRPAGVPINVGLVSGTEDYLSNMFQNWGQGFSNIYDSAAGMWENLAEGESFYKRYTGDSPWQGATGGLDNIFNVPIFGDKAATAINAGLDKIPEWITNTASVVGNFAAPEIWRNYIAPAQYNAIQGQFKGEPIVPETWQYDYVFGGGLPQYEQLGAKPRVNPALYQMAYGWNPYGGRG